MNKIVLPETFYITGPTKVHCDNYLELNDYPVENSHYVNNAYNINVYAIEGSTLVIVDYLLIDLKRIQHMVYEARRKEIEIIEVYCNG